MIEVTVDLASRDERGLIEGLFQFYVYDFAEMYRGDGFEVGPDGRYDGYPDLDSYWTEADRDPFLIRADGRAAGFALVNAHSHRDAIIDRAFAEFFIMRPFRGGGVGRLAAQTLLRRFPGRWELAIAGRNDVGRRFWPRVIESTPGIQNIEITDLDGSNPARRIFSFRAPG